MASVYTAGKGTSSEAIATAAKAAAIGAAYKTVPVREAAAALLEAMVNSLGLADVQRAVNSISDKNLGKAATEALAKVTAACGGATGMLSAGPSQASGVGARPATPRAGGSRPPSRGAPAPRPGSAGGVSRPGTAGSGSNRGLATTGSVLSRPGTAAAAAAAVGGGSDGPLIALDRNKEERAKKVRQRSHCGWQGSGLGFGLITKLVADVALIEGIDIGCCAAARTWQQHTSATPAHWVCACCCLVLCSACLPCAGWWCC